MRIAQHQVILFMVVDRHADRRIILGEAYPFLFCDVASVDTDIPEPVCTLPEPVVRIDAPSTLQATLNHQKSDNRYVLHVLHYIPERRGEDFDVIEDVFPLYNIPVSLNIKGRLKSVQSVPDQKAIPFERIDGRLQFIVPEIVGHHMIEIR